MVELPFEYWNKLATQLILTCALLGGFSIAVTANLLVNQSSGKLYNVILKVSTISSGSFLIAVFAMINVLQKTTDGYPFEVTPGDLTASRIVGGLTYILGIVSLLGVIGLAGWTKSKGTGIFTTVVSIISLILILVFL